MKGFIVSIFVCFFGVALGNPLVEKYPIPNKDGSVTWMTEAEARLRAVPEFIKLESKKEDDIKYFLFTPSNVNKAQEINEDLEFLKRSHFNANYPTKISVHGWGGKWNNSQNILIKNSFLKNGRNESANVIIMDWSVYSDSANYYVSKSKCSAAGQHLAKLLDWLHVNAGLDFKNVTLIGHSLGAHVVGFTGKSVTKGRIDTVYGLDPAMPLFSYENPKTRLAETDASYVETIQTNGGLKGFYQPIGKVSFHPNGGKKQPGCGADLEGVCSHARSVEYFAEAVRLGPKNNFIPVKCSDFDDLKEEKCDIFSNGTRLGDPLNYKKADGVYFLLTNSETPFGIGVKTHHQIL